MFSGCWQVSAQTDVVQRTVSGHSLGEQKKYFKVSFKTLGFDQLLGVVYSRLSSIVNKLLKMSFESFWNNTPYTSKQPLMMAYEGSESTQDNFGKFIYQFQPETKTLIRKLERILNKLYRQNVSSLFNET